jgi:hypothetical protein
MMGFLPKEFFQINRHILAILSGMLGGVIPNDKSNIHPLIMGAILAILAVKVLIGDYDPLYQWTWKDIVFVLTTICEGAIGAGFIRQ